MLFTSEEPRKSNNVLFPGEGGNEQVIIKVVEILIGLCVCPFT